MDRKIERTKEFRIEESKEKLNLSKLMIIKGMYNDSFIFSYLSMFYSVRLLLIVKDVDSDENEKILELVEKYYEPSGWIDINIIDIIKEAKLYKEKMDNNKGILVTKEEAEKFSKDADLIHEEVLNIINIDK